MKTEIDNYFNNNYEHILLAIKKTKSKYRASASWNPEELLTNAYEHLIANHHKIAEQESNIEAFIMKYITNQIVWTNSEINKQNRPETKLSYVEQIFDYESEEYTDEYGEYFNISYDLRDKINKEKQYNIQMTLLNNFYKQLPTKQEKILYEVIYIKGINTMKKLSKHFGINKNNLTKQRMELNEKLRIYINENYEKINS
jgi:hypothetical protein